MTSVRFRYNHRGWASVRRWLFQFATLNAMFVLPMLLARTYGFAPSDLTIVRFTYLGGTLLAALIASAMLYGFTRTRVLSLDPTHMLMPHYLWPAVRLERITAVHVDPRQPGVLLLGVHRQLPRYIRADALSPAITAEALADCVRAAVAGIDPGKAQQLERASQIARRTRAMPWACVCLAAAFVAVHAIAWHAGSRFDDLDLLASGAYLHSLVLQGDVSRTLDAALLHAHVPHLLGNVATLLMLGAVLEQLLGWRALLVTFVGSASIAIAGAGWLAPELLHVGASGGLFGLIGVLLHLRVAHPAELPAGVHALPLWLLFGVVALSLGVFVPGVDWMAHALGLVSGICIAVVASRWRAAGNDGASMDAQPAASRSGRFRARVIVPTMLVLGAVACTAVAFVDVSRRALAMGHESRLAALNQLATSRPNLEALNDVAWRSVVIDGEFPSTASALIAAFTAHEPLSPAHRDTLAALHLVSGSADKAADEQLTALLAATDLPQQTQEAMAARLAAYVLRTDAAEVRQHRLGRVAGSRCVHVVDVTGTRNSPQSLGVSIVRGNNPDVEGNKLVRHVRWSTSASLDCTSNERTWNLKEAAPSETQWIERYE